LKVAVSSTGGSLDSAVDPRFGRSPYHVIVETETMAFEAMPNASMSSPSGAGIGAAQAVAGKGIQAVLTGSIGPNASSVLSQVGIKMFSGASGTVRQAVETFKEGRLSEAASLSAGMIGYGRGRGGGRGMGMGRGMGVSMRGTGMGRGAYGYPPQPQTPYQPASPTSMVQEKESLTQQLKYLEEQLKEVKKRLEELE
jgi:predicted Fe-Mo cluster-binding NifX family protein